MNASVQRETVVTLMSVNASVVYSMEVVCEENVEVVETGCLDLYRGPYT